MVDTMDSIKVTGVSLTGMSINFFHFVPWFLGVTIGVLNIVYLLYKIKKIRSES